MSLRVSKHVLKFDTLHLCKNPDCPAHCEVWKYADDSDVLTSKIFPSSAVRLPPAEEEVYCNRGDLLLHWRVIAPLFTDLVHRLVRIFDIIRFMNHRWGGMRRNEPTSTTVLLPIYYRAFIDLKVEITRKKMPPRVYISEAAPTNYGYCCLGYKLLDSIKTLTGLSSVSGKILCR